MLKTLYLIIWLAAMSYADIKRRKINIISIVVMGAGIIMLHLADVIDGSELELHLLIRDYYIPAVIIGAGLYIIARITHITGEADAIVIAYITVLTGMYITIQTVLLSMFLIIIAGGTLIAGGRMKLRTSMPYIPFLLVSLVCCVIGGGTILRTYYSNSCQCLRNGEMYESSRKCNYCSDIYNDNYCTDKCWDLYAR